jgi:taurine transport system substrate-binding protein
VNGYFRSYATDTAAWGADSENVKLISKLQGGTPADVVEQLKSTIGVPALEEQTSDKWLGGGENGGVAKILKDTADFLKDQKKITAVKDSYADFADPQYAEAAKTLSN